MLQAGFVPTDTYLHDFDDDGGSDEIHRKRTRYKNALGWVVSRAGWRVSMNQNGSSA